MWKYDYARKFPALARVPEPLHKPIYRAAFQRTFYTWRTAVGFALCLIMQMFAFHATKHFIPELQIRTIDGLETYVPTARWIVELPSLIAQSTIIVMAFTLLLWFLPREITKIVRDYEANPERSLPSFSVRKWAGSMLIACAIFVAISYAELNFRRYLRSQESHTPAAMGYFLYLDDHQTESLLTHTADFRPFVLMFPNCKPFSLRPSYSMTVPSRYWQRAYQVNVPSQFPLHEVDLSAPRHIVEAPANYSQIVIDGKAYDLKDGSLFICRDRNGRAEAEQLNIAAPEGMLTDADWESWCRRTIKDHPKLAGKLREL